MRFLHCLQSLRLAPCFVGVVCAFGSEQCALALKRCIGYLTAEPEADQLRFHGVHVVHLACQPLQLDVNICGAARLVITFAIDFGHEGLWFARKRSYAIPHGLFNLLSAHLFVRAGRLSRCCAFPKGTTVIKIFPPFLLSPRNLLPSSSQKSIPDSV